MDIVSLGTEIVSTTLTLLGSAERKIVISLGNAGGFDWEGDSAFIINIVKRVYNSEICIQSISMTSHLMTSHVYLSKPGPICVWGGGVYLKTKLYYVYNIRACAVRLLK